MNIVAFSVLVGVLIVFTRYRTNEKDKGHYDLNKSNFSIAKINVSPVEILLMVVLIISLSLYLVRKGENEFAFLILITSTLIGEIVIKKDTSIMYYNDDFIVYKNNKLRRSDIKGKTDSYLGSVSFDVNKKKINVPNYLIRKIEKENR